ncbi:hypothetical protein ACOSQ2_020773 [Xanthoceras sorbifolium]
MTNRSRSRVSILKKTGDGRFRFNVLEEQLDEAMKAETIECLEEKFNSSALKDVTNTAGKGGKKGKGAVGGVGNGR